jgi:hypothetical protein
MRGNDSIGILIGSPEISGGTYVIYEHAYGLLNNGYKVTLITKNKIDPKQIKWHPYASRFNWISIEEYKGEKFELVIATWCMTVFDLHKIDSKKYAYFIQSIESRFFKPDDMPLLNLVDSTYLLNLPQITIASWIQKYLKDKYSMDAYLVKNGIRKDLYSEKGVLVKNKEQGKLRILIEGPIDVPFKNVPRTIELCKTSNADEIWLLTLSSIKSIEGVDRVFSKVPIEMTPEIYRSCDVIVKLSLVEGMFGPPLEMFHCGGTAITFNVTGHDEYIIDGKNGFVIDKNDDIKVIEKINELKKDRALLNTLKKNALITANEWPSWSESNKQFIKVIEGIINSKYYYFDREKIKAYTEFHFKEYVSISNKINHLQTGSIKRILMKIKSYLLK